MAGSNFVGEKFQKVVHFAAGGTGSGESASNPLGLAADNATVWNIPAGTLIEKVYVVITTGLAGTTAFDIGDDDDADGFFDSSVSVADITVAGMYGWDAKSAGAYLRIQTAGATDAADIYVVPNAKYYSAAGKEIKMDLTTAATAGALYVVIEGQYLGR